MRKIGIIGGAGPLAGSTLFNQIIHLFQKERGAHNDSDFPEIFLINYPFSSMMNSFTNAKQIEEQIQICVDKLALFGADIGVIACNTLHHFSKTTNWNNIQHISIVDVAVEHAITFFSENIMIAGTKVTREAKLYDRKDLRSSYPTKNDQLIFDEIIHNVLTGKTSKDDASRIEQIIAKYPQKTTILACTELSVLDCMFPIYGITVNPLICLAEKCFEESLQANGPN